MSGADQFTIASPASGVMLSGDGTSIVLSNEFASVTVAIDHLGNGPRLAIRDPSGRREILLDPLELQALAWTRHEELRDLLRPSHKEKRLHEEPGEEVDDLDDEV